MKPDISSREDLRLIVKTFYEDLLDHEELSPFFEEFKDAHKLEAHLKILVDFWDNTLFYSGTYTSNAIRPHIEVHEKKSITAMNFEVWLNLFNKSVDQHFKGLHATTIKNRALSIATVMRIKLKSQ